MPPSHILHRTRQGRSDRPLWTERAHEALQRAGAPPMQSGGQRLDVKVKSLETSDPQKAQALRQEVLFYARQNLTDIQTQQAVCVTATWRWTC